MGRSLHRRKIGYKGLTEKEGVGWEVSRRGQQGPIL